MEEQSIPAIRHKRNVSRFFSEKAKYWRIIYDADAEGLSPYNRHDMNRRKEAVLDALDRFSGGNPIRVLDAGCGAGVLMEEIARRGHQVTGLDVSLEMAAQAAQAVGDSGLALAGCVQGDLEALSFRDHAFDAVVCVGVLQYLPGDKASIAELGRVLRPGGLVVVTLPNILRISNLLDPVYYLRGFRYLVHLFRRKTTPPDKSPDTSDVGSNRMFSNRRYFFGQLKRTFRESGLESIDVRCIGFGPLTFWRRPILPERISLSISDRFASVTGKAGWKWMGAFSNRWVISLQKGF